MEDGKERIFGDVQRWFLVWFRAVLAETRGAQPNYRALAVTFALEMAFTVVAARKVLGNRTITVTK